MKQARISFKVSAPAVCLLLTAMLFGLAFYGCSSSTKSPAETAFVSDSTAPAAEGGQPDPSASSLPSAVPAGQIAPYSDVRVFTNGMVSEAKVESGNYTPADIKTFWFNADTLFSGHQDLALSILENGKNPGLGVQALHAQGITGKGIHVAIIDQNLAQPFHPEFADRIVEYVDIGTGQPAGSGSMHGPAVASLLVGQSCGVAPGADLYFVAAPSWTQDSEYQAKALRWIIEKNKSLPEDDKIRVVSISAAPSGNGSPFTKNTEMWDAAVAEAQAAGLLVLDCRVGTDTGIVVPGYYDPEAPDDITRFTTGFPQQSFGEPISGVLFAPTSFRTTAEAYTADHNSYQFTGQGGLSWGIPYTAGVLALGWQVDPSLTNDEIIALLFGSAYTDAQGNKIINPPAFIKAIQSQ